MKLIDNETMWYGNYGGCFVADAFSVQCDDYFHSFEEAKTNTEFINLYQELVSKFINNKFEIIENSKGLNVVLASENYYSIIGTAALAKYLKKKLVLVACKYTDEAILASSVCTYLGLPLKMFISKELANITTLVDYLKQKKVTVASEMCEDIFNLPDMYAFQEWLSNSEDMMLLQCRSNAGAFPQPQIASYFAKDYVKELNEFLEKNGLKNKHCYLPIVTGSYAIELIDGIKDMKYTTVECDPYDDLIEEKDSYCGTFTKVMRNNKYDRILTSKLSFYFDENKVERKIIKLSEVDVNPIARPLSLQSYAAVSTAEQGSVVIIKSLKEGTNL